MKVLKEGLPWEYRLNCKECLCKFSFTKQDMHYKDSTGDYDINSVTCPCCGKHISFHMNKCLYSATTTATSSTSNLV
jgi:RNase P subunit RPR2